MHGKPFKFLHSDSDSMMEFFGTRYKYGSIVLPLPGIICKTVETPTCVFSHDGLTLKVER